MGRQQSVPHLGIEAALVDLGPHVRAGDVNGGVLPALSLAALEAANVEAVELDQIAGLNRHAGPDRGAIALRAQQVKSYGMIRAASAVQQQCGWFTDV